MDAAALVARVRDHHIEQFRRFVKGMRRDCSKFASEVKLRLNAKSDLYQALYCVDFIKNDPPEIFEMRPDTILDFAQSMGTFGNAALTIERLVWDDVVLGHDCPRLDEAAIADWFRTWFDAEDVRHDPAAGFGNVIHSLNFKPGQISVDFGTAEPQAFWDMLALLVRSGATRISVNSSRDPGN